MENYMINFSISTFFPFITTLKERPKIEMVTFVKRTEKELEKFKKTALAIYDFTDYEKKGSVIGILKKGKKQYQLLIISTGITCFPSDSTELFDFMNPHFDFKDVEKFVFENVDTNEVVTMEKLFYGFEKLKELDLSSFSTEKVSSMYEMFYGCSGLTDLNLNHFDTSHVEDFSAMFGACSSLKQLEISHWDTSNAKYLYWMFSSCESLKELNIGNFKTSKVEFMYEMFQACYSMQKLDIGNMTFNQITLGEINNDRVFIEMKEDATILVKSEKERTAILKLGVYDRPIKWNNQNVFIKEKAC